MKLATQTFVFAAALAASTMPVLGAVVHADPDPHIPNMAAGYCPGGGIGSQVYLAYCDGVPYPAGSYWHTIQYGVPMIGHPNGLLSLGNAVCGRRWGCTAAGAPGWVRWGCTTATAAVTTRGESWRRATK